LEAQIYRLQEERKLETLKLYLEENFRDLFAATSQFNIDVLNNQQKKQLLNYLENI
jgi:hypothetical protein